MLKQIKVRFTNGALMPLEPVALKEGDEVMVTIDDKPQLTVEERIEKLMAAAGGWEGLHDPEEFKRMIYQARMGGSGHARKW